MEEPLQCLPQQTLKRSCGDRLVLRHVNQRSFYLVESVERWLNNIASKSATEFLRASQDIGLFDHNGTWRWPAVVLTSEEYKLRVGEMSVTELRQQLENYWGQGGIMATAIGKGYPVGEVITGRLVNRNKRLGGGWREWDLAFNYWVEKECTQWLSYFIAKNHTLGAVHAWFAAFLGITRESLDNLAEAFTNIAQSQDPESEAFIKSIHCIKFRMSFDVCIEGHDEVVDGLPSLPSNAVIMTNKKGMQVIHNSINNMFPRRIWDICANTVIPATWFCGPPCPLTGRQEVGMSLGIKPVSHAWVADQDLSYILTEANQQMWPIPLPKGVLLEDVRGELIRLRVRYAWLDVLCLRQQSQPTLATDLAIPISTEAVDRTPLSTKIIESHEQRRSEEWKVDLPTIGAIYSNLDRDGLYGGGPIVIFMSGLGRPFRDEGWDSKRHWLRRAWTLQETPVLTKCLIAGLPSEYYDDKNGRNVWPWTCKVDHGHNLYSIMENASSMQDAKVIFTSVDSSRNPADLNALLLAMRGRHSSNPIDKVCAIAFPLQKRGSHNSHNVTFPIYDPNTPVSVAWERLISSIASAKMEFDDLVDHGLKFYRTTTIQLLCLFPHPSRHHWFPSWAQVQQYPDVSVRDNDLVPVPVVGNMVTEDMDYSLRIVSGRIYRGCSLWLRQPPTAKGKAAYHCSMNGELVELVATVPGLELNIDPRSTYVLVDISPDCSLWPSEGVGYCRGEWEGHVHRPIWQESVIIVCKEVDSLAQPVRVTTSSPAVLRYRLRRITTLEWNCERRKAQSPLSLVPRHPRYNRLIADGVWLPFKPSLEHMKSVVCSAEGGPHSITALRSPDVFCDPAVVAGLPVNNGRYEWDKCPVYEVYLV